MKKILTFVLTLFMALSVSACDSASADFEWDLIEAPISDFKTFHDEVKDITLSIKPTWGQVGNMITTRITVSSDGTVIEEKKNDLAVILSEKEFAISNERFLELENLFYRNKFFNLPDDVSTDSCDGSFLYLEVVTEKENYRKGGLNPSDKRFKRCFDAVWDLCNAQ